VQVRFADTGQGIPPESLEKIFNPFFTTRQEGTGLGLAITHRIVQGHGGRIEVASRIGEGTTFTMVLPIEKR
jgi:signal transduction histidine kinase